MANAPCLFDFACPYHVYDEYGNELCTHPTLITTQEDLEAKEEEFGFVEDIDCPFMECGCALDNILTAYVEDEGTLERINDYSAKREKEAEENYKRIQERNNAKEDKKNDTDKQPEGQ